MLCHFCSELPATTTYADSPWTDKPCCARCESEMDNREPSDEDMEADREMMAMAEARDLATRLRKMREPGRVA